MGLWVGVVVRCRRVVGGGAVRMLRAGSGATEREGASRLRPAAAWKNPDAATHAWGDNFVKIASPPRETAEARPGVAGQDPAPREPAPLALCVGA